MQARTHAGKKPAYAVRPRESYNERMLSTGISLLNWPDPLIKTLKPQASIGGSQKTTTWQGLDYITFEREPQAGNSCKEQKGLVPVLYGQYQYWQD